MANIPLKKKNISLNVADKGVKAAKTAGSVAGRAGSFATKGISAMQQGDTPEEGAAQFAKVEVEELARDAKDGVQSTTKKVTREVKKKVQKTQENRLKQHYRSTLKTKQNYTARYANGSVNNTAKSSARAAGSGAKSTGKAAKTGLKTAGKAGAKASQWAAKSSAKMASWSVKVSAKVTTWGTKTSAKIAAKTAEVAAKAAKETTKEAIYLAEQAAQLATRAAAAAAKAGSAVIAAIGKALSSVIAYIGAYFFLIVLIVALIAIFVSMILYSEWGILTMQNEAEQTLPEVISEINPSSYWAQSKIEHWSIQHTVGEMPPEIVFENYDVDGYGETFEVDNWIDIIAVFFTEIRSGMHGQEPVNMLTAARQDRLEQITDDMFSVSVELTEVEEIRAELTEEEADAGETEGKLIKKILHITVEKKSLTAAQAADMYNFTDEQRAYLDEILSDENREAIALAIGQSAEGWGEPIVTNPNMPISMVGDAIVHNAKRYIGRSYAAMDCSALVRAAYNDSGIVWTGTSTEMAKKCVNMNVVVDESQLMPGDLVFWRSVDPSRGAPYCGNRRCGGGKCKRWNMIHHVAIYIGDGKIIESATGGVSTSNLWETSKWQIAFYARPYVGQQYPTETQ